LFELDQYQNLKIECNKDTTTLNAFIERNKVFEFLPGPNIEFAPILVQNVGEGKTSHYYRGV
jgi:hypothetical protein